MEQLTLIHNLKKQGAFWSYAPESLATLPQNVIIEECLRWGDVQELFTLFDMFKLHDIEAVWQNKLIPDDRLRGQNYYLARIYFDIEEPNVYFEPIRKKNSRYEQLNKLTS